MKEREHMVHKIKLALKWFLIIGLHCLIFEKAPAKPDNPQIGDKITSIYDFDLKDIHGKKFDLNNYRGKVLLIVNTASQCGFTPQLKDLEDLQKKYGKEGFQVIGFPSNDFNQDPGTREQIANYAQNEYHISFPLMDKNPVSGKNAQPLFQYLTQKKPGTLLKDIQWNFEKFLVNRKGEIVDRWSSVTSPSSNSVTRKIEEALRGSTSN